MKTETGQAIMAKIREIASEKPDYVYDRRDHRNYCVYVDQDQDGQLGGQCIVGRALVALGLIDPAVVYEDGNWQSGDVNALNVAQFDKLARRLEIQISTSEEAWIQYVQRKQDDKISWAKAVEIADSYLRTAV